MSIRSIAMTVACSVAGLLSVSEAKADPYYWGAGYGWGSGYSYSSYYAPSYGGYYAGYYPSTSSGYSPYYSTSYYWPSYGYASYAPAYSYGYGNSCCSSCCNSCGVGGCGVGGCGIGGCGAAGCGVPDRPAGAKNPVPDSPPRTYEEGKDITNDPKLKQREGGPAEPAPPGPAPAAGAGDAEEQKAFKPPGPNPVETDKPVVIPQKNSADKAPISAPPEGIPGNPDVINGPKSTTPPAPKDTAPAPTAPPAEKKAEPAKTEDKKVDIEDLKKPVESVHPAPLQLDAKVTWRNAPSRTRLASQPAVAGSKNVRQSTIYANRNWVPVGSATTMVKK